MTAPAVVRPHRRPLARLADFSYRRRRSVLVAWLVGTVAVIALSTSFAGDYSADYAAHGSDSDQAQELLDSRFPADAGPVDRPGRARRRRAAGPRGAGRRGAGPGRARDGAPRHRRASSPYDAPEVGLRRRQDRTRLDPSRPRLLRHHADRRHGARSSPPSTPPSVPACSWRWAAARSSRPTPRRCRRSWSACSRPWSSCSSRSAASSRPASRSWSHCWASRSGSALIGLLTIVIDTPEWAPQLAAMMALGIGIDYVLLMLTRYREYLAHGLDPEHAVVATMESSGRAVLVAGTTVVISMLGLFATDLNYMQGASVATIASVLVIMLAAVTLRPGAAGLRRSQRRPPAAAGRAPPQLGRLAALDALEPLRAAPRLVVRAGRARPARPAGAAVPRPALRLPGRRQRARGHADARGVRPAGRRLRPGCREPAARDRGPGAGRATSARSSASPPRSRSCPACRASARRRSNADGDAALLTVVPTTSPQDEATDDLVVAVRDLVPAAVGRLR